MSDQTPGEKSGKPLSLSGETSRIIQSLAGSQGDAVEAETEPGNNPQNVLDISEQAVARVFDLWRARSDYFPDDLCSDPAWLMLLELLLGELQGRRVSLMRLCNVSAVPASTAHRWIKCLERYGYVIRRTDLQCGEDEFAELSPKGRSALNRYFHHVVQF